MTTNAQAALQAAATWHSGEDATSEYILECAESFKAWLDEEDDRERKSKIFPARTGSTVKGGPFDGAGNIGGVSETRRPSALDLIDGDGTAGSARAVAPIISRDLDAPF